MKLHLPSSLRKALLACVTSLLSTTLATATFSLGGICSYALADEPIVALSDEDDEDDDVMPIAGETGWTWDAPGNVGWATEDGGATSGNASNPGLTDLGTAAASAYTVSGAQGHYRFTGGAEGSSLKLNHSAGIGNPVYLYFQNCNVTNLWLMDSSSSTNTSDYYIFSSVEGYENIQNIYISSNSLFLGIKNDSNYQTLTLNTNFILGSLNGHRPDNDSALVINARNVQTSGRLEISEAAQVTFGASNAALSVSELAGSQNLTFNTSATGASLTLANGGAAFGGSLTFGGNQVLSVLLGAAEATQTVTLQTSGLNGTSGGNISRAENCTQDVILRITGTAGNASNVTLGSHVLLSLAEDASQTLVSSTLNGGASLGQGSSLTLNTSSDIVGSVSLATGSTLTLNGTGSISNGTLSSEGTIAVVSGTLTLSQITLGSDVNIEVSLAAGTKLDVSDLTLDGHEILLIITDERVSDALDGYRLVENWDASYEGKIVVDEYYFGRKTVTLEGGVIRFEGEAGNLVWEGDGDSGNLTWRDESAADGEYADWAADGDEKFYQGDNVTFRYDGGGTVTLAENITAGNIIIDSGAWTFDGASHTLEVQGTLNIGEHEVTLSGGTFDIAALSGSGTLNYNGTGLAIGNGESFFGELVMQTGLTLSSSLSFAEGGKIVGSTSHELVFAAGVNFKGDLELQRTTAGGNASSNVGALFLTGGSTIDGSITLLNDSRIETAGNATAVNTVTGDFNANGHYLELIRGGGLTINGTVSNLGTLYITNTTLTFMRDITQDSLAAGVTQINLAGARSGYTGNLKFAGNVSGINSFNNGGGTITFLAALDLGSADSTFAGVGNYTISGTLTGTGNITKTGAGAMTFDGNGNFSGYTGTLTQAAACTVTVNAAFGGSITHSTDATLNIAATGSVVGAVSVKGWSALSLAGSVGSLTVTSNSAWSGGTANENKYITISGTGATIKGGFSSSHTVSVATNAAANALTVEGELDMSGQFRFTSTATGTNAGTLTLSAGGTVGAQFVLEENGTLVIGDDETLSVGALHSYTDGKTAGGSITTTEEGSATLLITGTAADHTADNITIGAGVTLEMAAGAAQTLTHATIVGDVLLGGEGSALTFSGEGNTMSGTLRGDGGALVVASGATLSFSGTMSGGALVVSDGATLDFSGTMSGGARINVLGTLEGELTVGEGGGTLGINVLGESMQSLSLTSLVINDNAVLTISLMDLLVDNVSGVNTETLLFADWANLQETIAGYITDGKIVFENAAFGRKGVSFDKDTGMLSYYDDGDAKDLTWNGSGTDEWFDATVNADRRGDQYWTSGESSQEVFYNYDSVTFGEDGGRVAVNGEIITGDMTVNGEWTFTGNGDDSLTVGGSLTLNAGSSLTLDNVIWGSDTLIVGENASATMRNSTLNHVAFTVGGNVTLENVTLKEGSKLAVNAGSHLTLSVTEGSSFGGTLELGDNARVTLDSDLSITGWGALGSGVSIEATSARTLTLQNAGSATTTNGSITFGENITLVKTGSGEFRFTNTEEDIGTGDVIVNGTLDIQGGMVRINGGAELNNVKIAAGAELRFWKPSGRTRAINGEISGEGTITLINQKVEFNGGGTLGGNLVAGWGNSVISLGKDLTVNGLAGLEANNGSVVTLERNEEKAGTENVVTLTLNTTNDASINHLQIGAGVKLLKTGSHKQTFAGNAALNGDVEVREGELDISGMTSAKTIGGNLMLSGGTLTWGTGTLTVKGSMTASDDSIEVAGGNTLHIGNGGSIDSLSLAAATEGDTPVAAGALVLDGGTLTVENLSLGAGASLSISLTGETKIAAANVDGSDGTLHLSLADVQALLESATEYALFEGSTFSDWASVLEVVIDNYELGKIEVAIVGNNLVFTNNIADLVWGNGSDAWTNGAGGWIDGGSDADFTTGDNVIFDNAGDDNSVTISGDIEANRLTVRQGNWTIQGDADDTEGAGSLVIDSGVSVQNGASLTFNVPSLTLDGKVSGNVTLAGEGTVTSNGMTVDGSAALTISAVGEKNFGGIVVEANGTVTITTASGWASTGANNKVTGEGKLVIKDITTGVESANTTWDDFKSMMQAVLDANGTGENSTTTHLARLDFDNTQVKIASEANTNALSNYIRSAKEVHVLSGSSIGFNGAIFNNSGGGRTLFLAGNGANEEGVLYLTGNAKRTVNWDVTLEDDAWVNTAQSSDTNIRMEFTGTYDGSGRGGEKDGYVLHKSGYGALNLRDTFHTVENSKGAFEVHRGLLSINASTKTALANYDIKLSGGHFGVMADGYVIHALGGESGDSMVDKYRRDDSTDVRDTEGAIFTLTINNSESEASAANTYAGGISGKIMLAVSGGYEKLTGTFADGAGFRVSGTEEQAAVLELAGTFGGAHTIIVGGHGTLKFTDVNREEGAHLTILAEGTSGVMEGLVLEDGDILGIPGTRGAGANDAEARLTLRGGTTFNAGSTLQFGVQNGAEEGQAAAWATSTSFAVDGTFSLGNGVNISIDPYGRMANGEILTYGAGTKHLLIAGGDWTAEKLEQLRLPEQNGRFRYELVADGGNLYVQVVQAAGILTWTQAAGGSWNTATWSMDAETVTFADGDAVVFGTLSDVTGPVLVRVDDEVKVGGMTVRGNTSYTIRGNIAGTDAGDQGLVVSDDFTGTLTLDGENSWAGSTTISSGTVVAAQAGALSDTAVDVKSGAELQLAFGGALSASSVTLESGATLTATAKNAAANVSLNGGTLQAASGATLAATISGDTAGDVLVNTGDGMTGEVALSATAAEVAVSSIAAAQGTLAFVGSTQFNVGSLSADAVRLAGDVTLHIGGADSVELNSVSSSGATLSTATSGTINSLKVSSGTTALKSADGWTVGSVSGSGALSVDSGSLKVTEGGSVGSVMLANKSSLNVTGLLTLTGTGSSVSDGASLQGSIALQSGASLSLNTVGTTAATVTMRSGSTLSLNGTAARGLAVSMLGGGTLVDAGAFAGSLIINDEGATSSFDLGGASGNMTLNLHSGSRVVGLGSSITLSGASYLYLAADGNATADSAFLSSNAESVAFALANNARFVVNATNVWDILKDGQTQEVTYYIFDKPVEGWKDSITLDADSLIYMHATANADGSISFRKMTISDGNVFESSDNTDFDNETHLDGYESLDGYVGTVVDRNTSVDLSNDDLTADTPNGLLMRNLVGTQKGSLKIDGKNDTEGNRSLVTIQNTYSDDDLKEYAELNGLGDMAVNNEFTVASSVEVHRADLQILHATADELLVTSRTVMTAGLSIENGDLLMTSGELELRDSASRVEAVKFAGSNGQLVVNSTSAEVTSLSVDDNAPETAGNPHVEHVRLENGGELVLGNEATVGAGIVIGNADEFGGMVTVGSGVMLSSKAQLMGVVMNVAGDLVVMDMAPMRRAAAIAAPRTNAAAWELAGLTGSGALVADKDMNITVAAANRTYSGDLSAYNGAMTIKASSYEQIFAGVTGGAGWSVVNETDGHVTFDLMPRGSAHPRALTMNSLRLEQGSDTTILLDMGSSRKFGMNMENLTICSGANVTFEQYAGTITLEGEDGKVFVLDVLQAQNSTVENGVNWRVKGIRNIGDVVVDTDTEGKVTLKVLLDNTNRYLGVADNANSVTGAKLLWSLVDTRSLGGDLAAVDAAVLDMVEQGTAASRAKANRTLAAVAGASLASVGQAVNADMERQLRAIRNRTSALVYNAPGDTTLNVGVWMNAESNYYKLSADGLLPGVKTTGWGGTVGAHINQDDELTLGLAITAMYSDITSNAADRLKGDMDSYYLSAFAQVADGAWRHTFVFSVGHAEVDAKRTVDYGIGSYGTQLNTSGMSYGAMYEVGYSVVMNDSGSMCFQPVFNIAWRGVQMDAYREHGSNAALNVDAQTQSTVTLGLGARLQAALGESALNRVSFLEARALVKADLGDHRSQTNVALQNVNSSPSVIRSAERSVIGFELGAGFTVPLGEQSDIFIDCNADLRSGETNLNATVGYKLSF